MKYLIDVRENSGKFSPVTNMQIMRPNGDKIGAAETHQISSESELKKGTKDEG
jgi:hypothetical protein